MHHCFKFEVLVWSVLIFENETTANIFSCFSRARVEFNKSWENLPNTWLNSIFVLEIQICFLVVVVDTKPLTPIGSSWASVSMHKTRILLGTGKYLDVKNAITKDLCNSSKLKCFDELARFEFSTASRIALIFLTRPISFALKVKRQQYMMPLTSTVFNSSAG